MNKSESIKEISSALSKFQSSLKGAEKGGANSHFKSKYSTLEDVWNSIRLPLGENGLSIIQELSTKENSISVLTLLLHSTGEWIEFGPLDVPFGAKTAHGVGSACSYAKRYALCAAMGIVSASDDDDGNAAVAKSDHHSADEVISSYEAHFIENELSTEDPQFRIDLLKYFTSQAKLSSQMTNFFNLPKKFHAMILKAIQKRKEAGIGSR